MEEIDAATRRLKQALVERMLGGELTRHLGYAPGSEKPDAASTNPAKIKTASHTKIGTGPKKKKGASSRCRRPSDLQLFPTFDSLLSSFVFRLV